MTVYDFKTQLAKGKIGEHVVFKALTDLGWDVITVDDLFMQSWGIDAIIKSDQQCFSVEVKTDEKAGHTGNIFLESKVISDGEQKLGNLFKTTAQLMMYYIPPKKLVIGLNTLSLRNMIKDWQDGVLQENITRATAQNTSWRGEGFLVPIKTAVAHAWEWSIHVR